MLACQFLEEEKEEEAIEISTEVFPCSDAAKTYIYSYSSKPHSRKYYTQGQD